MISARKEKISRAVYKCWGTVYGDEWIGVDYDGRGQGFSVQDLIDGEFEIDFHCRKEWWIPGERIADVKNIVKQRLMDEGINLTKLKIYGKTYTISWMDNRKFVRIRRIEFVEKS